MQIDTHDTGNWTNFPSVVSFVTLWIVIVSLHAISTDKEISMVVIATPAVSTNAQALSPKHFFAEIIN